MSIRAYRDILPRIDDSAWVDPDAVIIGDVEIGPDASVWPGAVIRGDVNVIRIGAASNIQDNAVLHVTHDGKYTPGGIPLLIGDGVTVGHSAVLHACTVGDHSLIGMGAVVLDGAEVGDHVLVAAGAVVSPGKVLPPGTLWRGNPAREARSLSDSEIQMLEYSARNYVSLKNDYMDSASD